MDQSTNPLILIALDEERGGLGLFQVYQDFTVSTPYGGITVPAGFKSDLATIPRLFRWLLPQAGHSAAPGLVHDFLMHMDDKRATKVFSYLLRASGAGGFRRALMVSFVAIFTLPSMLWGVKG